MLCGLSETSGGGQAQEPTHSYDSAVHQEVLRGELLCNYTILCNHMG